MERTWTEADIQDVVYIHAAIKNHELIVPNSCLFSWEADVLTVTKAGFIHEFEIKISRGDFKVDAKKERAQLLVDPVLQGYWGPRTVSRPNYFHYVVPEGLIAAEEVPSYAGLIYAESFAKGHRLYYGLSRVVKEPSRLHGEKITEAQRRQLDRALIVRYWRLRLNGKYPITPEEKMLDEMYA